MNLSFGKKVLYSLGQFGLVLCAFGAGKLFVSFFITRTFSDTIVFPIYIYQGYFFGLFTAAGLIIALGKLFDAGAGLFFGYASDRNTMKRGRRIGFMLISALPVSLFSALIFFPPTRDTAFLNSVYVLVSTVLFYCFLSLYSAPYLALLSELGGSPRDRMHLSTLLAIVTAFAALLGNRISYFMDQIHAHFDVTPVNAFRLIIVLYALVSAVCMMVPALCLDEKKYCGAEPVSDSFPNAVKTVWKDAYFRPVFIADIMYRIAISFAVVGFSWYVTRLLGLAVSVTVLYLLVIFFSNLVLFAPVSIATRFIGKRKMLFAAFILLMAVLTAIFFAGKYQADPFIQGLVLSILVAVPISVFTVVPNALIADLAVAAERRSGMQRGGMYFGMYSLSTKAGQMFSVLLFPSLLTIGARESMTAGRAGLRLTLILAILSSFIGFVALFFYREKEVTVLLEKE